jgi:AraC family transcriptional regulator
MNTSPPHIRHYGAILMTRKVGDLTAIENSYAPGIKLPQHAHGRACFCLVLEGAYTETFQRKSLACGPLSILFRPAGEVHADRFDDVRVRCFIIEFESGWLDRIRRHCAGFDGPTAFRQHSLAWTALKIRREINRMDALTPLAVEGLMLEMMADASRASARRSGSPGASRLKRVMEILHQRVTERLTLSDLGREVGMHPVYLAAAFRRAYGCTIGEYVRQRRVEWICRELSATNTSLAQLALDAGFADQSQLSRAFKRAVGLTPTAYRKIFRAA